MTDVRSADLDIEYAPAARVAALLEAPDDASACLVLAHGAGAGMTHAFMTDLARALHGERIATLRYQFPFIAHGGRPDPPAVAHAVVRAAVATAVERMPGVGVFAGGKSFGGRMTSQAQAASPMPSVRGLVFVGFPLHPAGKPSIARAAHLADVHVPMLFLQGTRDALAELPLLTPVIDALATATVEIVDDADHAFHVRRSSGRSDREVVLALATSIARWTAAHRSS